MDERGGVLRECLISREQQQQQQRGTGGTGTLGGAVVSGGTDGIGIDWRLAPGLALFSAKARRRRTSRARPLERLHREPWNCPLPAAKNCCHDCPADTQSRTARVPSTKSVDPSLLIAALTAHCWATRMRERRLAQAHASPASIIHRVPAPLASSFWPHPTQPTHLPLITMLCIETASRQSIYSHQVLSFCSSRCFVNLAGHGGQCPKRRPRRDLLQSSIRATSVCAFITLLTVPWSSASANMDATPTAWCYHRNICMHNP